MSMQEITLDEKRWWSQFLGFTEKYQSYYDPAAIWRGQSKDWNLLPSIARILDRYKDMHPRRKADAEKLCTEDIPIFEDELYHDFKMHYGLYADPRPPINVDDKINAWIAMQHHGFPTRILDWTSNPFVAAYFAVCDNEVDDGVIYVFHGAKPSPVKAEELDQKIIWVMPCSFPTRRSVCQAGVFTISGRSPFADHGKLLEEHMNPHGGNEFHKIIIPWNVKGGMQHRLECFNISARTLFPDLDGFAKDSYARLYKYLRTPLVDYNDEWMTGERKKKGGFSSLD